jgi:predicted GTPase
VASISETFQKYPAIGTLLPAMGYGKKQIKDLETTINRAKCDTVIIATPIDLNRIIKINKPTVRVGYDLQEIGMPNLSDVLGEFFAEDSNNLDRARRRKAVRRKGTRRLSRA